LLELVSDCERVRKGMFDARRFGNYMLCLCFPTFNLKRAFSTIHPLGDIHADVSE